MEGTGTAGEQEAAEARDYVCLAHRTFVSLQEGGAEEGYDVIVVAVAVVVGDHMIG